MSKDPAILFYTSDFLTGTMTLTDEQVGKYIRLLCLQHQKDRLTKKDMLYICKSYDEDIFSKFAEDENGLYFNRRMHEEVERRQSYSDSRRNNRRKKDKTEKDMLNICKTYDEHMENENANEDINTNRIISVNDSKRFTPPKIEEVEQYCQERNNVVDPEKFYNFYKSKGWMVGKTKMKDWKASVITWEKSEIKGSQKKSSDTFYYNLTQEGNDES